MRERASPGCPAGVRFGALDNAPHEVVLDPETHTAYQQTHYHAPGADGIAALIVPSKPDGALAWGRARPVALLGLRMGGEAR